MRDLFLKTLFLAVFGIASFPHHGAFCETNPEQSAQLAEDIKSLLTYSGAPAVVNMYTRLFETAASQSQTSAYQEAVFRASLAFFPLTEENDF